PHPHCILTDTLSLHDALPISALARLCLDRRIPTMAILEKEILAIIKERNDKKIKIHWQFSLESARSKLNSHYNNVLPSNSQYKRSEEHTSELQSRSDIVCRLL